MANRKYYAFISYKREDERWAEWLQRSLERYHFPTTLNGREDLPKAVRPVFRDVTDLTPAPLELVISQALDDSEWLIVVCSPRSAQSQWVSKEAQAFIDSGRGDHIIPFVIEGTPFSGDPATECYPEALLSLRGERELLGANINEAGRDAALVKVVARMFNLNFDTLWQRHERERRRRRRIIMIIGAVVMLALVGVALWIFLQNRKITRQNQDMLVQQERFYAYRAARLLDDGDTYNALMLLNEITDADGPFVNIPLQPEVEYQLRRAVRMYDTTYWKLEYSDYCNVENVWVSDNGLYLCEKNAHKLYYWDEDKMKTADVPNCRQDVFVKGDSLVSVEDWTIFVQDINSSTVREVPRQRLYLSGVRENVFCNTFLSGYSNDGKLIAERTWEDYYDCDASDIWGESRKGPSFSHIIGKKNYLTVYRTETGALVSTTETNGECRDLRFCSDGIRMVGIVRAAPCTLSTWNVADGRMLKSIPIDDVIDDKKIAILNDDTVLVYGNTSCAVYSFSRGMLGSFKFEKNDEGWLGDLASMPGGEYAVSCSAKGLSLFDIQSGSIVYKKAGDYSCCMVNDSLIGTMCKINGNTQIRIFRHPDLDELVNDTCRFIFGTGGSPGEYPSLLFSGKYDKCIAVGMKGLDDINNHLIRPLRISDENDSVVFYDIGQRNDYEHVLLSDDERWLYTTKNDTLQKIDLSQDSLVMIPTDIPTNLVMATHGLALLVAHGDSLYEANMENGQCRFVIAGGSRWARYSPDGKKLLAIDINGVLRLFDSKTGNVLAETRDSLDCLSAFFTKNMKSIVVMTRGDGTLHRLNAKTLGDEHQFVIKDNIRFARMEMTDDDKVFVAFGDKEWILVDIATMSKIDSYKSSKPHAACFDGYHVSKDGKTVYYFKSEMNCHGKYAGLKQTALQTQGEVINRAKAITPCRLSQNKMNKLLQ